MDFLASAVMLAWIALALQGLAIAGLMRQLATLRGQQLVASGQPPSRQRLAAPASSAIPAGVARVLLFADSNCESCRHAVPTLLGMLRDTRSELDVHLLLRGPDVDGWGHRFIVPTHDSISVDFSAYGVTGTPWAVYVSAQDTIELSQPIGSEDLVRSFIAATAAHHKAGVS